MRPDIGWTKAVAVGECGLDDSYFDEVPCEIQLRVFQRQIEIAMEFDLPIVLHLRGKVIKAARQLLLDTMVIHVIFRMCSKTFKSLLRLLYMTYLHVWLKFLGWEMIICLATLVLRK